MVRAEVVDVDCEVKDDEVGVVEDVLVVGLGKAERARKAERKEERKGRLEDGGRVGIVWIGMWNFFSFFRKRRGLRGGEM